MPRQPTRGANISGAMLNLPENAARFPILDPLAEIETSVETGSSSPELVDSDGTELSE